MRYLLYLVCVASTAVAQPLSLSLSQIDFGTKQTNVKDSLTFRIRNSSLSAVTVTDINTHKAAFSVRDTTFNIPANDSVTVKVFFQTNQNVTWKDVLVVENTGGYGSLSLRLSGTGTYNEPAYASTQNLWEGALKTALTNLVTGHTSLGYNTARDRMFETIDDGGVDTIECVYIGRKIYATTRTAAQNQNFNTEHTWPQSFFNSAEPMVSDIHHLFPTDANPNSQRANYPFAPVVSNITYNVGGSKLGRRADGANAFEPRDVHKGDVARCLFYFMIRYGNQGSYMDATQEIDLRAWHKTDPVSSKETARNNAIASFQGKRSPFIDHPEFMDRITALYTSAAPVLYPALAASPSTTAFGSIGVGDSVIVSIIIVNSGRNTLNLTSVTLQSASTVFSIISSPGSIPVDTFGVVRVRFKPSATTGYANGVVITSNDPARPSVTIPLSGSGVQYVVLADVRFMLEGPYNTASGTMNTTLRSSGVLATRYPGMAIPAQAVDSVSIEIRDSASATSASVRKFRPAWLMANGTIRSFADTTKSFVEFDAPAGQYYIVARHANHLPVMSNVRQALASSVATYDFVLSQSQAYGTAPLKQLASGVFGLYGGDTNVSGIVTAADANSVFGQLNIAGYSVNDVNLSGIVTAADANLVFGNLNRASQVP